MNKPVRHSNRARLKEKMIHAAEKGDNKALAYILDQLGGVNVVDKHKDSALMVACEFGRAKTVDFLLAEGANPHLINKNGDTALHLAVSFIPNVECIKSLLRSGPPVDVKNNQGQTPLLLGVSAIAENHIIRESDHLLCLVENGASLLAKDNKGQSAAELIVYHAAKFGSPTLVQYATSAKEKIALDQAVASVTQDTAPSPQGRKF